MIGAFLSLLVAFYVPGSLLTRWIRLTTFPRLPLALILGMVMWAYQGFFLGLVGWREGTYVYLAVAVVMWLYFFLTRTLPQISWAHLLSRTRRFVGAYYLFLALALVGIGLQASAVWQMGVADSGGILYCCRGVPDSVYHMALTNRLVHEFPPEEPGAQGIIVRNYHYWSNVVVADLVRIFNVPLMETSFRVLPVVLSALLAASLYVVTKQLALPKGYLAWLTLLVFFHGDLVFLLRAFLGQGLRFDILFLDDASKLMAGLPRGFAVPVMFWVIALLIPWFKQRSFRLDVVLAMLIASLVGFKVYTFAMVVFGLIGLGVYWLITRQWKRFLMPVLAAALSLMVYWPVNGSADNGLFFHPPWLINHFIEKPGLGLVILELRRQVYEAHSNWFKLGMYQILFMGTYGIFVFGTVNLAFVPIKTAYKRLPLPFHIFCWTGILASLFLGYFSSQKNGGLNTMQFAFNFLFVGSIYAALVADHLYSRAQRGWLKGLLIILMVSLTLTRAVHEGMANVELIPGRQAEYISADELEALTFLAKMPNDEGLLLMPHEWAMEQMKLHISLRTNLPIYVTGYYGVLYDHNIGEGKERLDFNERIFKEGDPARMVSMIEAIGGKYIYAPVNYQLNYEAVPDKMRLIFNNETVSVVEIL
jgi:hypothetical protein